MPRLLLAAAIVLATSVRVSGADSWKDAYQRGDYAAAATLLQRAVFEPAGNTRAVDIAALKHLALLYAEGKGVERDAVLACGLLRVHAVQATTAPRAGAAARKDAAALVERYCMPLTPAQRAAGFAAMSCPRVGMQRGARLALEPDWTIQFNDRSATIARNGETREQPLPGDLVCRSQVLLVRHSQLDAAGGRSPAARHVVELVTLQSGWRAGAIVRALIWQLYEVRGLSLDLAAVQRWEEPGSAWPAPPLPESLARGVSFALRGSGEIEYEIVDAPPRRGRIDAIAKR